MAISRFQMNRQLRAYGGIMGQDGRRNYGIGSFFQKKIMDPIKKVVKSPAGLAATALAVDQFGIPIGGGKKIGGGKNVSGFLGNIFKGLGGGSSPVDTEIEQLKRTGQIKSKVGNRLDEFGTKGNVYGTPPFFPTSNRADDDKGGFFKKAADIATAPILGTDKTLAGLLMTPQALALGSGLLAGAFTKDEEDPLYTGQDVGLNLADIGKLANISDPKTASAIGLRFSPDVEARKFTPAEMAATYAANAPADFTQEREPAQDGGIMGDQKDFEQFLQDKMNMDKNMLHDQILEDFKKYMERKRMIENLPEAKDGGIMRAKPKKISMEPGQENTLEQIYFDLIDAGMSPDEAAKKAREIYMNMSDGMAEGGMMDMGGMEMDLRGGGFVPMGRAEKADDVPARLSKNEFVFTADAVRAAGGGNVDKGADKMYATMKKLEDRVA